MVRNDYTFSLLGTNARKAFLSHPYTPRSSSQSNRNVKQQDGDVLWVAIFLCSFETPESLACIKHKNEGKCNLVYCARLSMGDGHSQAAGRVRLFHVHVSCFLFYYTSPSSSTFYHEHSALTRPLCALKSTERPWGLLLTSSGATVFNETITSVDAKGGVRCRRWWICVAGNFLVASEKRQGTGFLHGSEKHGGERHYRLNGNTPVVRPYRLPLAGSLRAPPRRQC